MKFKGARSELLTALQRVQGVVEKRNTMPILSNILLEAGDQEVVLFATDLEIGIRERFPAEVSEPGGVTVSARKMYEIIRELPDGTVNVSSLENHTVRIEAGKSEFKVLGLAPQEFPAMPSVEGEPLTSMNPATLSELIRKTVFAAGDNDARYILNGLLVSFFKKGKKPSVRLVGTDGHRLAVIERSLENGKGGSKGGESEDKTLILPKKAAMEIRKILEEEAEEPQIGTTKNQLIFRRGGLLLLARLMEGNYPNYEQVVPKENDHRALVKKQALEGALRRVSILSREKTNAVKFALEPGSLTVSSSNPDMGEATETLPLDYQQGELQIGFNARYLLDILAVMEGEDVSLEFKDALSPCVVRQPGDPDYLCVVMPMRV